IISVAFFVVMAASLLGNCLVCYLILFQEHLRKMANLSTLNLAISDLLITSICLPIQTIHVYLAKEWIFGSAMCKVSPFFMKAASTSSILNIFVSSLEKFLVVCFPLCFQRIKKYFSLNMLAVWVLSFALPIP
ncbi:predicted protein, partial [Nematostella vectensis]